jgi:N-acetylglucosamine malate deacetylase 2
MQDESPNSNDLNRNGDAAGDGLWQVGPEIPSIAPSSDSAPQADVLTSAFNTAAVWIRRQRENRFGFRPDVVNSILDRFGGPAGSTAAALNLLVVVAHPDDEVISAGAVLRGFPNVTIVHATDGAPADPGYAQRKGFLTREAYAEARRAEVVAALDVIGIPEARIQGLGFVDGEASWHLVELCHKVADLIHDVRPDVVLTHPYEGGHSDHDSTAFAVHLAAGLLRRDGLPVPVILELASYHNYKGRRRMLDFLPFRGRPVKTIRLGVEARGVKRTMLDLFTSQRELLRTFPIDVERFRQAPRYLFTVPPHEGELDYERLCKKMTGAEWRANAARALELLRTRPKFTGM